MRALSSQAARRALFAALWLVMTAGVAYLVAQGVTGDQTTNSALSAPPVAIQERQTVALTQQSIQPIVSGDGVVIADGNAFNLEAPVSPQELAYQLLDAPVSVKALIAGGPAGFDCAWLGLGQGADGSVTMRCRIPEDIRVVSGLTGTMVLSMSAPVVKPALPVTAVVGSSGQGQVVVVAPDGTTSSRQVGLGISDTFWIEIASGLGENDKVLAAPVQGDFSASSK